MGSSEEGNSSKSDKSPSSPTREQQNNVHVYPDWAAMQAYYGPRVALPPYFNSAVTNGHPPPYMWAPPQMMMPPYGAPYAAIYSTGGVYAHPAVPYGCQQLGQGVHPSGVAASSLAGTALSTEVATKSPGDADQGLMKKLKSFDGLAMSIGNGNSEKDEAAAENGLSQSSETEGSSNGSHRDTEGAYDHKSKRSREGTSPAAENEKTETKPAPSAVGHVNSTSEKVLGFPVTAANGGEMVATVLAPNVATTLELMNPGMEAKANLAAVAPSSIMSSDTWLQNERELKREKRKQSNRESARRSRLRKQAETEVLARRVESLTAENTALRAELNQLVENSKALRQENARLMEKLKGIQPGQSEETGSSKFRIKEAAPVSTENLLSRVDNSGGRNYEEGTELYDKGSNSGAKLHQLLDANPRADAVAAG